MQVSCTGCTSLSPRGCCTSLPPRPNSSLAGEADRTRFAEARVGYWFVCTAVQHPARMAKQPLEGATSFAVQTPCFKLLSSSALRQCNYSADVVSTPGGPGILNSFHIEGSTAPCMEARVLSGNFLPVLSAIFLLYCPQFCSCVVGDSIPLFK